MKTRKHLGASYYSSRLVLIVLLLATFFPFVMMINMSLKPTVLISTSFLSVPKEPYWENFIKAFKFVKYILVDAPIDRLPLFAKAGAILPVSEGIPQSTDEIRKVVLEIFPGNGSFVHYTDDGETMDYETGCIHALKITVRGKAVTQSVAQAGYPGEDELEVVFKGSIAEKG